MTDNVLGGECRAASRRRRLDLLPGPRNRKRRWPTWQHDRQPRWPSRQGTPKVARGLPADVAEGVAGAVGGMGGRADGREQYSGVCLRSHLLCRPRPCGKHDSPTRQGSRGAAHSACLAGTGACRAVSSALPSEARGLRRQLPEWRPLKDRLWPRTWPALPRPSQIQGRLRPRGTTKTEQAALAKADEARHRPGWTCTVR